MIALFPRLALALLLLATRAALANDAPVVDEASFDTDEDTPLAATLKASDNDGDALAFRLVKPPRNGTVIITPDGGLSYVPKQDWHGKDELTFQVTDGTTPVVRKAVITVSSVNDPPTATVADIKGQEDKPVQGVVVAKDADGDPLNFLIADEPEHGAATVDARTGRFQFTPNANDNGLMTLVIRVSDGTIDVDVPVRIVLETKNDPPVADVQQLSTREDEPLKGELHARDIDDDALAWTITQRPAHGTVEIDAAKGTFSYTPAKEYAGSDAFAFSASDGKESAKGRVDVEVQNVNDPPTIYPLALEGAEDLPLYGQVVAKDFDGDEVFFAVKTEAKHGEGDVDRETGVVTYTPKANFFGADAFTVEASDIAGGVTTVVAVTIMSVNDVPVARADSTKGDEDQPTIGKLRATDLDKDALTFTLAKAPNNGTVEIKPDGAFRFLPNASFNGDDAFLFEVSDGKAKAQAAMELIIKAVNDAPQASDVKLQTNEDVAVKGSIAATDIDKDALTFALARKPKKGDVIIDEQNGSFVYQPSEHENGDDSFTVKVSDGTAEADATVSVTIAAVNDAPVAQAQAKSSDEDHPVQGDVLATDVDNDPLSYQVTIKPRSGVVELDGRTGAYRYTPSAQFNGEDGFRFEVSDGKLRSAADIKLSIAAVNDAPDTKGTSINATEDKAAAGVVAASDIDKDKLTWSAAKAPLKGKVVVEAATGRFTYMPNLNENGEDSFIMGVSDGRTSTDAKVTIAIAAVNDAPIAIAHENAGKEDEVIKGNLSASDVDKDKLTYLAASKPRLGTVALDASAGTYVYTPRAHENGEDGFRFEVTDGQLRATAEVKLTIAAVNDAPEPKGLALTTVEDREVAGKLLASDVDKDVLTFRLKGAPKHGLVIVDDATGALRYTPARDQHGPDAFVIETTDGLATADATVTVAVAAASDAPLVDPSPIETAEDEPVTVKLTAIDPDSAASPAEAAAAQLSFKIVTQASLGTAQIESDGKTLRFVPRADQHGEDQLVVEAFDGEHRVRATLPILVAARNDPPTVDKVSAQTLEETPVLVSLVAHDKDGDPVTLALDPKQQIKGLVTLSGSLLHVTPRKDFAGPIEVDVIASDASGKAAPTRIVITVMNVNDAPVAKDLALTSSAEKPQGGVIEASDVDAGDELTFSVAVPPRQGVVTIDDARAGRFNYTAAKNAQGDDTFRIRVRDKAGASVTATVRVTLTGTKPAH